MADQDTRSSSQKAGGLPIFDISTPDSSNINMAGVGTDPNITQSYKDFQKSQKDLADSLEKRYSEPNYWKVAAGFAKPQLGGFLASLGSASEAMGENTENQRAVAPTVARMRAEIARGSIPLAQGKLANDIIEQAKKENRLLTPQENQRISQLTGGAQGAAKAGQEVASADFGRFISAIQAGASYTELTSKYGKGFVDENLPYILQMRPDLQNKYKKDEQNPSGGQQNNPPTPNGQQNNPPASGGEKNIPPAPSNQSGGQKTPPAPAKQGENQDWADPAYKVAPAPVNKALPQAEQVAQLAQQTKDSKNYLGELSAYTQSQPFTTRIQTLRDIGNQLNDQDIRVFAQRASQQNLSKWLSDALKSNSSPDAIAKMLEGSGYVRPGEDPEKVAKYQRYVANLAKELIARNNLVSNPTNSKFGTETGAGINLGTQPKTAYLEVMRELHNMQRQALLPGLLEPYAQAGYSQNDMLNSQRVKDYLNHWNKVHGQLEKYADPESNKLPVFLTDPNSFNSGYDFRKKGKEKP